MTAADGADDRLLADLGDAVRERAAVPDSFVAAAKAAFAWRTVDAELAALSADSGPALAGLRSGGPARHELLFTVDGLTIDVQVTESALQGLLDPADGGTVELHRASGAVETTTITDGWFAFRPAPRGLVRLRVTTTSGRVAVTPWTRL